MKIFIVGSGKLANAIITSNISITSCEVLKWEPKHQTLNEKAIIVHAGSGRQLKECIEYCSRTKSVLIELSTGLESEKKDINFPLIVCPNTSVLVLKTLNMINLTGKKFSNYDISITESHQSTKKTEPGTAYAFAQSLNVSTDKIVSVRNTDIQQNKIGIPEEFLSKHAYHKIVIKDEDDEITIETKVLGHKSYANGVKKIIEAVFKCDLENKEISVLDLIANNLL